MRQIGVPAGRQLPGQQAVEELLALRFAAGPGVESALPALVGRPTAIGQRPGVGDDVVGDLEAAIRVETENLLGGRNLLGAESRAVNPAGVHLGRGRVADDGAHRDERGLVGDLLRRFDRFLDADDVLAALNDLDMPAVCLIARRSVLGERDIGVVFDGDLVVVPEDDQVAQLLSPGQRARLAGDALLHVAVGGDHIDVVIEGAGAGRGVGIEQAALEASGHCHADRRGQPLTERAGGDLHAPGVSELRMPGGLGVPGAQRLDVGQFQAESAQVQLYVEGEAAVAAGQDETVATQPPGVAGVVPHDSLEQGVGQRCQAHRGAGVAVADLLNGIGRQHPRGVNGA